MAQLWGVFDALFISNCNSLIIKKMLKTVQETPTKPIGELYRLFDAEIE
jgi:hypothetical protein